MLVFSNIDFLSGHTTDVNMSKQSFTNSQSDNGFLLFAIAFVIKKLTLVATSEHCLAALKKDC